MFPGAEEVRTGCEGLGRGKVLVRIETETFEVGGDAGYDELEVCKNTL